MTMRPDAASPDRRGARRARKMPLRALVSVIAASCVAAGPAPHLVGRAPSRLHASEVVFASRSGSEIHGWMARGREGRGAVLLLHGVGASRLAMVVRAEFLHDSGFTVLLPDFQAHGESPGRHATYGALESLDAAAALDFLRSHACGERVGVIGVSMGGAAALLGPGPLRADALVLESVYPTIRDATADRLETWLGPLGGVGRLLTPAVMHVVGSEIGVSEGELRPIDRIASVSAPVFLLAGSADPYTRLPESLALFARAPEPKQMWVVRGAKHEDLHDFAPAEYERRVGGFLTRWLDARAAGPRTDGSRVARVGSAEPEQPAHHGEASQCLGAEERSGG